MTKPPVAPPRLRLWDMVLLVVLCLATLLYAAGNLPLKSATGDGRENLEMGIWLAHEPDRAGYSREPLVPAVIATIILAQRVFGYEPAAPGCGNRKLTDTPRCRSAYAPYRILNVVFVLVAGVGVFFLCQWYAKVRWLPSVAFLLVTQSLIGALNFDRFYTEVPAAALLVMVSCLNVLTLVRRRVFYSALLGLILAALVLTKTVFLYFWPLVIGGLVASDLLQRTLGRHTVLLVGVFLIAHFLPIGGWMARNFILFDDFSIVNMDAWRVKQVLVYRTAYNSMRGDEFAAGFWYYTPYKRDLGVSKHSYGRLEVSNPDGFRQANRGSASPDFDAETGRLRAKMLADPWRHLKISTLMAWRGLFTQNQFGYARPSRMQLLEPRPLPRELLLAAMAVVRDEAHVVWFRGREIAYGYGGANLKELLNLETVAEFPDAALYRTPPSLYRVPPPDDSVKRASGSIPVPAAPALAGDCEDWTSEQFFAGATVREVVACLNAGANPNARNGSGATALHLAARFNPSGAVIGALVDAGADLHLRDNPGRAPLHLAAWQNPSVAVIKALIDAGADPNMLNDRGRAPLHLAAMQNPSVAVIKALIDAGADPNMLNDTGLTPLRLAAGVNSQAVFEALLGAGALPVAAEERSTVVVSEFLKATGADAAHWVDPSGMLYHFRNLSLNSIVRSNRVQSLPSLRVAVPRLSEVWGLNFWPRWGWQFDPLSKTLVNLVGFLALLVVPLWFWFGRRSGRIEIVFVMLPALYLHAVYAVASHFIPRYAQPEIPLRILAVLLLVCLVASSLRRLGVRRAPTKQASPPAGSRTAGLRTQGRGGSLAARLRRKAGRW